MGVDLLGGIAVRDRATSTAWYERLLGAAPSFLPNEVEAVWESTSTGCSASWSADPDGNEIGFAGGPA